MSDTQPSPSSAEQSNKPGDELTWYELEMIGAGICPDCEEDPLGEVQDDEARKKTALTIRCTNSRCQHIFEVTFFAPRNSGIRKSVRLPEE